MTQIALRIHVGTLAGARHGVPLLVERLQALQAGATFLLCLGPDQSGRAFSQAMRMRRHCGWKTPFRGTLIPAGDIGTKAAESLRLIEAGGFEAGISAWNRVAWEKTVHEANNDWVTQDLNRAMAAFDHLFGHAPKIFGAPDWQMHRHQLRLLQRQGFSCASDCRGQHPFLPAWAGEIFPLPQLPTSLPTLEELMHGGRSDEAAVARLLELTQNSNGPQVFSLRAEHEGLGYLEDLAKLCAGWQAQGHQLVSLGTLASGLELKTLPYGEIRQGDIPHHFRPVALQGKAHLA